MLQECLHYWESAITMEDLIKLSQVLDVKIDKIMPVVLKQATKNVEAKDISHLLPKPK